MVAHAGASSSSPAAHDVAGDIDVEMVVDPMCPWCYIGLKRLHGAVEAAKAEGISVAVRFSPYVFDPETPVPHLGWRDYVALRYPDRREGPPPPLPVPTRQTLLAPRFSLRVTSPAAARPSPVTRLRPPHATASARRAEFIYTQKLPYTISQAASVGLSFPDYDKRLISPTVASLSLLHIARQLGGEVEAKVVEQIFLQHFCKGRDTGDLQARRGQRRKCVAAARKPQEISRAGGCVSVPAGRCWRTASSRGASTARTRGAEEPRRALIAPRLDFLL